MFYGILGKKYILYILYYIFYTITTGNSRTRKSGFFQRGKSMVLIKKMDTQKKTEKCISQLSRKENAFLDHNNNKLKNSKNRDFSKRVSP